MNRVERYNEIQKSRANISAALGIGCIIAGGFSALGEANYPAFFGFCGFGIIFIGISQYAMSRLKTEDEDSA